MGIVAGMPPETHFTTTEVATTSGYMSRLLRRLGKQRGPEDVSEELSAPDTVAPPAPTAEWTFPPASLVPHIIGVPAIITLVAMCGVIIIGLFPEFLDLGFRLFALACLFTTVIPLAVVLYEYLLLAGRKAAAVATAQTIPPPQAPTVAAIRCPKCGGPARDGPLLYRCAACKVAFHLHAPAEPTKAMDAHRTADSPMAASMAAIPATASGLDRLQQRLDGWRQRHALRTSQSPSRQGGWLTTRLRLGLKLGLVVGGCVLGVLPVLGIVWLNPAFAREAPDFPLCATLTVLLTLLPLTIGLAAKAALDASTFRGHSDTRPAQIDREAKS
jgi:hypothetical protein